MNMILNNYLLDRLNANVRRVFVTDRPVYYEPKHGLCMFVTVTTSVVILLIEDFG